ncbi:MAG: UTP--glucose-1-phosphate uridylyltransferase [Bifidobacteriaceae bacterium]|jgi:UTP--glucose-1-phosphate uridylyltransferase|nr:UTP--glucose-1-phosphate uridylyltransferase [Bifidobacteriaceae bacterium]
MQNGLELAIKKMQDVGATETYIQVFKRFYEMLVHGVPDYILESEVEPVTHIDSLSDYAAKSVDVGAGDIQAKNTEALRKTAIVKPNGGLGTSMGLQSAKTLLTVHKAGDERLTFLDVIARQILALRKKYNAQLPLIFMNSFRTKSDTFSYLSKYETLFDASPESIVQQKEPKLLASDFTPAVCPENPELEWCPAGHAEVYSALYSANTLNQLQEQGMEYLFISNADNLGAVATPEVAGYFANTNASFMIEVAKKTPADAKGGNLVYHNGRLTLREFSQVTPEDMQEAMQISKHPYMNTNNMWLKISALKRLLDESNGVLKLPFLKNRKTLDPRDHKTPEIIQLESAVGFAVALFDDSTALLVPKSRFLPVKTTNDLFALRSDLFEFDDDYIVRANKKRLHCRAVDELYSYPKIDLDKRYFKHVDDFEARVSDDLQSAIALKSLTVVGDKVIDRNVNLEGDVVVE